LRDSQDNEIDNNRYNRNALMD